MAEYQNIFKPLRVGNTNSTFEKIYNCRVIDPPYEVGKGLHNEEFFLDKRLGIKEYYNKEGFHFTDDIIIEGLRYYLYNDGNEIYVGVDTGNIIKDVAGPFDMSNKTPLKFARGRGGKGPAKEIELEIQNALEFDNQGFIQNENGIYEDGYIKLQVGTGKDIQAGDYAVFNSNVFKGATIEIDLYEDGYIYVLGINQQGSLPLVGDTVTIYPESGKIPIVATANGVRAIHINGEEQANDTNILPGDIEDIVSFNQELFALKNEFIYFSTQTNGDNLQFYSALNRRYIEGAYKLVSKGKFLIVFGDDNRLVSPVPQTSSSDYSDYTFYPLNYDGRLYSKYSYIFTNTSLYILQSDKKLLSVKIESLNATAFNLSTDPMTMTVRGLMSDIDDYYSNNKGEIFVNMDYNDTTIHFFYQKKGGGTIEYEYDSHFRHWLLHTYDETIYKKTNKWLCVNGVHDIDGYTDLGKTYEQNINMFFHIDGAYFMLTFMDHLMGLLPDPKDKLIFDVDIEIESAKSIKKQKKRINDLFFDTLNSDHSKNYLQTLMNGKWNKHHGNISSVRTTISRSGRIIRVSINGDNRFQYGGTRAFIKVMNPFVHEPRQSF